MILKDRHPTHKACPDLHAQHMTIARICSCVMRTPSLSKLPRKSTKDRSTTRQTFGVKSNASPTHEISMWTWQLWSDDAASRMFCSSGLGSQAGKHAAPALLPRDSDFSAMLKDRGTRNSRLESLQGHYACHTSIPCRCETCTRS